MDTPNVKVRLDEAKGLLESAEQELETAMKAVIATQDGEKTLIASVLEGAFEKLREARLNVMDLQKLFDTPK
jgi:hypothetical protein